jgi:hypothetical protein
VLFPLQGYSSLKEGGKPTPLPVIFAVAMMADNKSCILVVVLCCCEGDQAFCVGKTSVLNGVRSTKFNRL